jgi:hypothetical protein
MTFDEFSDQLLGPVLDRMPAQEQLKLLTLLRSIEPPRAYPWIDRQLQERGLDPAENETRCAPKN